MTPSGNQPATFRFVAQYLNHCPTAVPSHCRCRRLFLHLFTLNDIHTHTHTPHTHTHTHTWWESSGRGFSPVQRPLPEITQRSQEMVIQAPGGIRTRPLPEIAQRSQEIVIQAPGGIRTRNSSKRVSAGLHLKLSVHELKQMRENIWLLATIRSWILFVLFCYLKR